MGLLNDFFKQESGATVVEYALMVFFIAMAVVITVTLLGNALDTKFNEFIECMSNHNC